ncbi:DNA recombination protein RmuC [Candidatus Profftia lariciata]|uniref:DNA recombination protein RmuC n=1 Tax=Candidatus Profftia lariciata TaxID=1987921 RepID=UPI001D013D5B|nr:DNA recombination protein RmuC [Candidatus Profftia lariciata]UDG81795.1 DNA recombination protein RmuC [Candidatus Profftia lariciata]
MDINIWCWAICNFCIGIFIGWLITRMRMQQKQCFLQTHLSTYQNKVAEYQHEQQEQKNMLQLQQNEKFKELNILYSNISIMQEKINQQSIWLNECNKLTNEIRELRVINTLQERKLREATIRLEKNQLDIKEEHSFLINSEQRLNTQFENLANRIFENTGKKVEEQNKQSLNNLLRPLREQLDGFSRQVQDSFGQEARERHTLAHEIRNLQKLNMQIAHEAVNLTKALKGDKKIQGNWGEVILSRVLEASGLREGHEYHTQVSIQVGNNNRMQPDVIVRLPQGKDVVVDAKMSLVAYERYFNADDDKIREQELEKHVTAVKNHIRQLGCKDYQKLPGIRSLDYVLMFIPVESAFLAVLNYDFELISDALRNNIILVSPTTLLVALRTINNLWRYECQNQNTQKIADRASRLYDKMRLFVNDMESIGYSLDKAQINYQQAIKKLAQGRGNLIGQIESFRTLGVEVKKSISPAMINKDILDNDLQKEQLFDPLIHNTTVSVINGINKTDN